ncbi:MAG: DUF3800 domain-containing protein [Candidatus Acidiferrales bacterium]
MRLFLDESGSFSWTDRGISLFCGVLLLDRELSRIVERFVAWKRSIIGESKRELKGQELKPSQLLSFCQEILTADREGVSITLVGADTRRTAENYIERLREQAAEMFGLSSKLCADSDNDRVTELYRQMAGWVRNRSTPNILWIIVLEDAVIQTVQQAAIRYLDPAYDSEFENIEIAIDQSFIRRDEHVTFWREWLRNGLMKSSRSGFVTVEDWSERNHPFLQKYLRQKGLYDFNDLYVKHTEFCDSRALVGVQIADICANICYRYFRGNTHLQAYDRLRPHLISKSGADITLIDVDERSLHKDSLSNHVSVLDLEEWKRKAAERKKVQHDGLSR